MYVSVDAVFSPPYCNTLDQTGGGGHLRITPIKRGYCHASEKFVSTETRSVAQPAEDERCVDSFASIDLAISIVTVATE